MCADARAQRPEPSGPAPGFLDSIKPLQIGDTIPEALWHLPLQVVNHPDGKGSITLNDYKGKLIILDFWTTWCSHCINGMPRMLSFQEKFREDIVVLPVTYQPTEMIQRFIRKNALIGSLPGFRTVANGAAINALFPSVGYPNLGIIDREGRVVANVRPAYLDENTIANLVNGKAVYLPFTRGHEQAQAVLEPAFRDLRQHKPIYYSMLGGVLDGMDAAIVQDVDSVSGIKRWFFHKQDLLSLYRHALLPDRETDCEFVAFSNRRLIEVNDPERYFAPPAALTTEQERIAREREFRFTYEMIAPLYADDGAMRSKMASDLNVFLGFNGRIEKREMDCLVLVQAETARPLADTAARETATRSIVRQLNHPVYRLPPVLNGIPKMVWPRITLPPEPLDVQRLNAILAVYGLKVVQARKSINMFILSEAGAPKKLAEELQLTEYGYQPKA